MDSEQIKTAFSKLVDRAITEDELKRLIRIKEVLNLKDNDALWMILIALDSYNTLYQQYPKQIVTQVSEHIEQIKGLVNELITLEAKKGLNSLGKELFKKNTDMIQQSIEVLKYQYMTCWFIGFLIFGAFSTFIGFVLGSGKIPFWLKPVTSDNFILILLDGIAKAPVTMYACMAGVIYFSLAFIKSKKDKKSKSLLFLGVDILLILTLICLIIPFFI